MKRPISPGTVDPASLGLHVLDNGKDDQDKMIIRPLGAGQEVGRSCHILEFKEKRILLDCGIHPGQSGMDALPYVDMIEADQIDLLLVSHFHLDHAGALPWFLQKTTFRVKKIMYFVC